MSLLKQIFACALICYLRCYYAKIRIKGEDDLSDMTRCVRNIIETHVNRENVIFVQNDSGHFDEMNLLMKWITKPVFILNESHLENRQGLFVLFANDSSLDRLLLDPVKTYDKSKFMVVWLNATKDDMKRLFTEFWRGHNANVIVLVRPSIGNPELYTFQPYAEEHCNGVGEPILLNRGSCRKFRLIRGSNFFPNSLNLHGCPLKCVGNNEPPDNIMIWNGDGWKATGVGYEMLKIAASYFDFVPVLSTHAGCVFPGGATGNINGGETPASYFREELNRIQTSLATERFDLAFGWYSYASVVEEDSEQPIAVAVVVLGQVSSIDCFGWAVPYRAGPKPSNWTYYTDEFDFDLWIWISSVLIIVSGAFYLTSRLFADMKTYIESLLYSYRMCLEQPADKLYRRSVSFVILFCVFTWYCVIMTTAYRAVFGSFMTVPSHGREFVNVEDILNSNLHLYGFSEMTDILNSSYSEENITERISNRLEIVPRSGYDDVISSVIVKREAAVLGVKRRLYYHSIPHAKRLRIKIPFRFIPGCFLRAHTTHFMFKKGSALIDSFNQLLITLFESGIVNYWILHLGSNKILPIERIRGTTLRLKFLKSPFQILITGYAMSFIVFICEILFYRFNTDSI